MTTVKEMLETADPLKHELPPSAGQRARIRQTVLTPSSHASSSRRSRRAARLTLGTALASIAIAIALASLMWMRSGSTVQAAVRFEVRLAEDQPAPGLSVARVANSNRTVYLHPDVVVTNADIAFSNVIPGNTPSPQFWIDVRLTAAGADRMRQATTNHLGRPVAILIDGEIVSLPTVKSAIGPSAVISGNFTRAEAEKIASGMNPNQ